MIRVLVADDHPAVRRGLLSILRTEPGFSVVAACGTAEEALSEAKAWEPDVALVDYKLPRSDGLVLTRALRRLPAVPGVVIYSAFATPRLCLAAAVAGAQGLVDKGEPVEEVFEAIRTVAKGGTRLDQITPHVLQSVAAVLEPEDHALVGLALAQEPIGEIASVLGRDSGEIAMRLERLTEQLRPRSAEPAVELRGDQARG